MGRQSFATFEVSVACLLAFATVGCGAEDPVNIGKTDPPAVVGASLNDYAGAWEGYAEVTRWADDTDFVRIRLDAEGNGVLEVGAVDAPAPDFTPDPNALPDLKLLFAVLSPGFSYAIQGATVTSSRIRMSTSSQQAYAAWCESFTPVLDTVSGSTSCIPDVGFGYDDRGGCYLSDANNTPISCASLNCINVCTCDPTSCHPSGQANDVQVDARLLNDGQELSGTLLAGERSNIVMYRTD